MVETIKGALGLDLIIHIRGACNHDRHDLAVAAALVRVVALVFAGLVDLRATVMSLHLVILLVNLQNLRASIISVLNWHIQVEDDRIEVTRLFANLTILILVELNHVVLYFLDSRVAILRQLYLGPRPRLKQCLHDFERARFIVDD